MFLEYKPFYRCWFSISVNSKSDQKRKTSVWPWRHLLWLDQNCFPSSFFSHALKSHPHCRHVSGGVPCCVVHTKHIDLSWACVQVTAQPAKTFMTAITWQFDCHCQWATDTHTLLRRFYGVPRGNHSISSSTHFLHLLVGLWSLNLQGKSAVFVRLIVGNICSVSERRIWLTHADIAQWK